MLSEALISNSSRVNARDLGEVSNLSNIIVEVRVYGEASHSVQWVMRAFFHLQRSFASSSSIWSPWNACQFNLSSCSLFLFYFTSEVGLQNYIPKHIKCQNNMRPVVSMENSHWEKCFVILGLCLIKFLKEFLEPFVDWVSGNSPESFFTWKQWGRGLAGDYPLSQGLLDQSCCWSSPYLSTCRILLPEPLR